LAASIEADAGDLNGRSHRIGRYRNNSINIPNSRDAEMMLK